MKTAIFTQKLILMWREQTAFTYVSEYALAKTMHMIFLGTKLQPKQTSFSVGRRSQRKTIVKFLLLLIIEKTKNSRQVFTKYLGVLRDFFTW